MVILSPHGSMESHPAGCTEEAFELVPELRDALGELRPETFEPLLRKARF